MNSDEARQLVQIEQGLRQRYPDLARELGADRDRLRRQWGYCALVGALLAAISIIGPLATAVELGVLVVVLGFVAVFMVALLGHQIVLIARQLRAGLAQDE